MTASNRQQKVKKFCESSNHVPAETPAVAWKPSFAKPVDFLSLILQILLPLQFQYY